MVEMVLRSPYQKQKSRGANIIMSENEIKALEFIERAISITDKASYESACHVRKQAANYMKED